MKDYDVTADFGDDPEAAIAESAKRFSNWNRWGADDGIGTVNFLDAGTRTAAAALIRRGESFSGTGWSSRPIPASWRRIGSRPTFRRAHASVWSGQNTCGPRFGAPAHSSNAISSRQRLARVRDGDCVPSSG